MATALHRTTKQYLASVNTPDYPIETWIINPDLSAVAGVVVEYWKITGDVVTEMSSAEKDAAELPSVKNAKCAAIDTRTAELIDQGFSYSSKTFSLSLASQSMLEGSYPVKNHVSLTYPIVWNTIDDLDTISLADATDLENFYLTALGTFRARRDSGTTLKDQVRAASTIAAVDAVVDSR